ncbi:MAG: transporter substrate-binding domain-containing protein, partial [Clostridiales bacterium]|nr:transporter substrate-binding domain-containing protein [Clostridiales bacterium]
FITERAAKAKKIRYATYDLMFSALKSGKIDACVLTGAYYSMYQSEYSLNKHDITLGNVDYAFASSLENTAFMEIASAVISDLKNNGELDLLINKYIG